MDLAAALLAPFLQLRRHMGWAFALMALCVALSLLGPALQIFIALPRDLNTSLLLHQICLMPMEFFLLPRIVACLDAELKPSRENPEATWRAVFEARWLKAGAARFLLGALVGIGLQAFVLPGLLLLFAYGWAPLRVLLRGEGIRQAARSSMALSLQNRMTMLVIGAVIGLVTIAVALIGMLILAVRFPQPTPWDRLTHPLFLGGYALLGALQLSFSLVILGLYHHIEARSEAPQEP